MSLKITNHAVERFKERYNLKTLDEINIVADLLNNIKYYEIVKYKEDGSEIRRVMHNKTTYSAVVFNNAIVTAIKLNVKAKQYAVEILRQRRLIERQTERIKNLEVEIHKNRFENKE